MNDEKKTDSEKFNLNLSTLTSSSIGCSPSMLATVVDVVVVVVVEAVVLFWFDTLPNINEVALSASAHPTIPIMAKIHQ